MLTFQKVEKFEVKSGEIYLLSRFCVAPRRRCAVTPTFPTPGSSLGKILGLARPSILLRADHLHSSLPLPASKVSYSVPP
jgi:hypothetical protein